MQTILFGLSGIRVFPDRLALNPQFVDGVTSVTTRGLHYRGAVICMSYDSEYLTLDVGASGKGVEITSSSANVISILPGHSKVVPVGKWDLSVMS